MNSPYHLRAQMTSDAGRRDKWQETGLKLANPEALEWQSAQ